MTQNQRSEISFKRYNRNALPECLDSSPVQRCTSKWFSFLQRKLGWKLHPAGCSDNGLSTRHDYTLIELQASLCHPEALWAAAVDADKQFGRGLPAGPEVLQGTFVRYLDAGAIARQRKPFLQFNGWNGEQSKGKPILELETSLTDT